jgi:hypothetical protein
MEKVFNMTALKKNITYKKQRQIVSMFGKDDTKFQYLQEKYI